MRNKAIILNTLKVIPTQVDLNGDVPITTIAVEVRQEAA
jgi:hypothetical protein